MSVKKRPTTAVIELDIDAIRPHPKNPKKHWEEGIEASIKDKGYLELVLIDENNRLIAGEGRWRALKKLGHEKVKAVKVIGLTERKKLEYLLASNKLVERGGWDEEILRSFERDLLLAGSFDTAEIDALFRQKNKDDDFDAESVYSGISEPVSKLGTLWKQREGIMNDKMTSEAFREFLLRSLTNMMNYCDGIFYVCMGSSELSNLRSAFEEAGGHWQSFIIWVKNTFTLSRSDWQQQYEPILYGWNAKNKSHYFAGFRDEGNVWKNLEILKPKFEDGETTIRLGEYHLRIKGKIEGQVCVKKDCVDIWNFKKHSKNPDHPTQKPVQLMAKAIQASSKDGDIVLDPFAGSGSTMVAAHAMNRRAYMIELDPRYADVIAKRWENLTGEKAEHFEIGESENKGRKENKQKHGKRRIIR